MQNTRSQKKEPSITRKDIDDIIEQAITRAIQIQRDQVLSALTSGDKEKTKALRAIDSLKVEITESLRKISADIHDKQHACKKDCDEAIVKASPNYLAIIGLAITIASPFIAWMTSMHYDIVDIKLKIASEEENSYRIQNIESWLRGKPSATPDTTPINSKNHAKDNVSVLSPQAINPPVASGS